MKEIGVAIIGAGRAGKMHAEIFAAAPNTTVVGIVNRHFPQKPRTKTRPASYANAAMAFADSAVDAVVIATSSDSHAELIRGAAKAGKKILCEKPAGGNPAEIRKLQKETRGKIVQVGFNRRYDPHFGSLQKGLAEKVAGRIYSYHIINRDSKRPPPGFAARSGGMIADFHIHDFDMLRFLSGGEIAEIYVLGAQLLDDADLQKAGDIDNSILALRMADGAIASVCCTRETNYGYDQRIEVLCEKGALRADNVRHPEPVFCEQHGETFPAPMEDFTSRYLNSFVLQARSFLAACRGEEECESTLEDAARAADAVAAGIESLHTNRPVRIAD